MQEPSLFPNRVFKTFIILCFQEDKIFLVPRAKAKHNLTTPSTKRLISICTTKTF